MQLHGFGHSGNISMDVLLRIWDSLAIPVFSFTLDPGDSLDSVLEACTKQIPDFLEGTSWVEDGVEIVVLFRRGYGKESL